MATTNEIYSLYLAYFGRPPDAVGFAAAQSKSPAQLQAEFSASAESAALLGSTNLATQVNNIYLNAFGRSAETTGLLYWVGEIAASRVTLSQAAFTIVSSALNDDRTTVTNKITAATAFYAQVVASPANIIGYSGNAASAQARTFLSSVTASAASVTAAVAGVAAAVTSTVAAGTAAAVTPGSTFTLTTGADSGTSVTGGAGNDTYNGVVGGDGTAANGTTLNPGDNLNGGLGTDTLNVAISGTNTVAGTQTTAAITLNGIERILVSNFETVDGITSTIDLGNATGVTTVGLSASSATGDTIFSTVKNIVDAQMINGTADLTVTYVDTVVAGAADAMTLTVGNQTAGTFTANGIETVNVVSGTSKNTVTLAGAQLEAVGVSGDQNLTLGTLAGTIKSVNASTFTGGLTATLNALTDVTVTGGAGNDTFTTGATLAGGTVAGGNGTDTLVLAADAHVNTAAIGARYTGFETLAISHTNTIAAGAFGDRSQDVSLVSGITGLAVTKAAFTGTNGDDADTAASVAFTKLGSGVGALEISGISYTDPTDANDDPLTVTVSAALLSNGTADKIAVTLGTADAALATGANYAVAGNDRLDVALTLANHESITLTSRGGANTLSVLDSTDLTTLTIAASKALTISAINNATALKTVDASTSTADVVISANASTTASTITGGSGNDTFVGGSKADSISGGNGNDALTGAGGNDTISGGAGNDNLIGADDVDNLSGGDGDDTFTVATAAHFAGLTAAETVSGGAGNDTLKFTAGATLAATDLTAISSIEVIDFNAAADNSITLTDAVFTANGATTLAIKDTAANALTVNASALGAANSVQVTANTAATTNDNLVGGAGNDTFSFATKDSATALDANDTVNGGKGTDTLAIALDTNSLTGVTLTNVSNIESITVTGTGALTAEITLATANFVTTDTATTVGVINASGMTGTGTFKVDGALETDSALSITGGTGADTLTGGGKADTISGGTGADQITGGAGSDNLSGGDGDDTFVVSAVADFIALATVETVSGGAGNDTLSLAIAGATSVNSTDLTGISGIETISFGGNNTSSIVLTDAVFTANGAATLAIKDVQATAALTVNAAALSAANSIQVTANGGTVTDDLTGGAGNDTFTFSTATADTALAAGDTVNGSGGSDTLAITTATNALVGFTMTKVTNVERITMSGAKAIGSTGTALSIGDEVFSSVTAAVIDASGITAEGVFISLAAEDDSTFTITGSAVADSITGSQKADTISAGAGNDTITGGALADNLTGGLGADRFVYADVAHSAGANVDSITDFTSGTDLLRVTLDYSALNAANPVVVNATRTGAGVEGLTAAQATLSGARGQFVYDTTNSRLYINVNNDNFISTTDFTIGVNAGSTASATFVDGDIEFQITGTGGADTITGGGAADTITAGDGTDSVVGGAGADSIDGGAGNDTITGGEGADTITGGTGGDSVILTETTAARDTLIYAGGDTQVTIGGTGNTGTISGYDAITALNVGTTAAVKDLLDFAGTAGLAAAADVDGTDSTLTIGGAAVKSHRVAATGVTTFDDDNTFAAAITTDGQGALAAVTQYLIATDIGNAGATLAFVIGGTDGTQGSYVYSQVATTAGATGGYQLVQLVGVTINALETTASTTNNNVLIA